jgi:Ca2+-transporting ATPase
MSKRGRRLAKIHRETESWHELSSDDVLNKIESNKQGLSSGEAKKRLARFGKNELAEKKKAGKLVIFLRQFKSFLVIILIAAAVISFIVDSMIDMIVITMIVIINALFGFRQEYKAEKTIDALKRLSAPDVVVFRNGKKFKISSKQLVPGDIDFLEQGNRVSADMRVIESMNLKLNEASLTGESAPVVKDTDPVKAKNIADMNNMVFMGTLIAYGRGTAVVTETGMKTQMGHIAEMIESTKEKQTPLQKRLDVFGKKLGVLILVICALVSIIGILHGKPVVDMFLTGVALAVAAIPEGLPAVVTITLTMGLQKLSQHNALVRQLPAVETLGCTTVICADKTGTLTKDEMMISKIWCNNRMIKVGGSGYKPIGKFFSDNTAFNPKKDSTLMEMLKFSVLCNNATLEKDGEWHVIGDPTEGAFIVSAAKAGLDQKALVKKYPRKDEVPFTSERKMMSTVHPLKDKRGMFVCSKGAPEILLKSCTTLNKGGRIVKLTDAERKKILDINHKMADEALRVLAIAYKEGDSFKGESGIESGLTFMGLAGMIDPPRPRVKEDIALCREAGIKVVMITGDHSNTAVAIAKQLNMLKEDSHVVTGSEMSSLSMKELVKMADNITVYARVNPEHKVMIIGALRKRGHIIAMTGDGVNDAPAIKKADIGIAMGVTGTDVAKEASDMILLNDDFSSIVDAVRNGRSIYDNIKGFIRYLLSSNMGEVLTMFIAMLLVFIDPQTGVFVLPLLAVQILWINLVTDGLPALALGTEPAQADIMKMPPRNPNDSILSKETLIFIVFVGVIMCIGTLYIFAAELPMGMEKARSMAFTTLVMFQMFNVFNCRSAKHSLFKIGILSNKKLILAITISILLQLLVLYLPIMQSAFGTTGLGLLDWFNVLVISVTVLIIVQIKMIISERRGRRRSE